MPNFYTRALAQYNYIQYVVRVFILTMVKGFKATQISVLNRFFKEGMVGTGLEYKEKAQACVSEANL